MPIIRNAHERLSLARPLFASAWTIRHPLKARRSLNQQAAKAANSTCRLFIKPHSLLFLRNRRLMFHAEVFRALRSQLSDKESGKEPQIDPSSRVHSAYTSSPTNSRQPIDALFRFSPSFSKRELNPRCVILPPFPLSRMHPVLRCHRVPLALAVSLLRFIVSFSSRSTFNQGQCQGSLSKNLLRQSFWNWNGSGSSCSPVELDRVICWKMDCR